MVILSVVLFSPSLFNVPSGLGIDPEDWNPETGAHLTLFFDVFVFLQVFNFFNARKLKRS
jgi:hypothetical protein